MGTVRNMELIEGNVFQRRYVGTVHTVEVWFNSDWKEYCCIIVGAPNDNDDYHTDDCIDALSTARVMSGMPQIEEIRQSILNVDFSQVPEITIPDYNVAMMALLASGKPVTILSMRQSLRGSFEGYEDSKLASELSRLAVKGEIVIMMAPMYKPECTAQLAR